MKKLLLVLSITLFLFSCLQKREQIIDTSNLSKEEKIDSTKIKTLFNTVLTKGQSYEWLRDLTQNIGGRLSGSPEAEKAVIWGEKLMNTVGLDSVWLQPIMVPHWVRGEKEVANYLVNGEKKKVPICALGFSVATSKKGVTAAVLEVKSLEEAKALGEKMRGKIVFFQSSFRQYPYQYICCLWRLC
ncbi:hypothetical protein N9484_04860 [Polaribacter sp.]|nr:hypothetical protein [Polaribacter sp.]